ncbi:PRC-barrel domain-containing protein (plasmid) [Sinorhizobium meliloti]|uniref:PRC-barrel domain containing protein n=1 Tax=Rhizobium meliloti TaxID=382 RepID=UPI002D76679D|nr:PRC-barrel domain-containing protein [Sinorhizobium meliloti]WRQ71898.1 PRC-barrel domain-containing protein [Sinorhizobium meliloti]
MLWSASGVKGCSIDASGGSIGTVSDLLFDDQTWSLRWIVVSMGLLSGRQVLMPPSAVVSVDSVGRSLAADVTREQVEDSAELDVDAPVSRRHERSLSGHGWKPYRSHGRPDESDPHLRSISEVTGYYVHARDGYIGHIEDFVVDTDAWAFRYLVVDTVNWWPGKQALVSPAAFSEINWEAKTVNADLTRDQIQGAPEYYPGQLIDRAYEALYHDYYGYPYYWQ